MRCLIIDPDQCGLDIALRAHEAGHEVRWWMPRQNGKPVRDGDGFGIQKVPEWRASMPWVRQGLVVNLYNDRAVTRELDKWAAMKWPIFGPSYASARLEIDRQYGMNQLKRAGIDIPPSQTFATIAEAIGYARKTDKRMVVKVAGDHEQKDTSYCASDPADLVGKLQTWQKSGKVRGPFLLQDFIPGIEMGVSAWMGSDGYLSGKWNINFEFKKLMSEDYGPNTGEMGTVMCYREQSLLADEVLAPVEKILLQLGHRGDVDLNCIIDDKGKVWPLEFTCRAGWPAFLIQTASHQGDPIKWMKDALSGKDSLEVTEDVACGVLMAQPPFPEEDDAQRTVGNPITGMGEVWDRVSPWQVMLEKGPVWKGGKIVDEPIFKTTGAYVACVNGFGPDVHDAVANAYAAVEKIKFASRMVRNDIGARLEKQLPQLAALGFTEVPNW